MEALGGASLEEFNWLQFSASELCLKGRQSKEGRIEKNFKELQGRSLLRN